VRTIWKYPLLITDTQTLRLPKGYSVLTVQLQAGALTLWADVQTEHPLEDVTFHVIGTGNSVPETYLTYIASVQMLPHVWHIFEELPEEPEDWPDSGGDLG
jgi:hypothetical protein